LTLAAALFAVGAARENKDLVQHEAERLVLEIGAVSRFVIREH
jgi:hypothetical protein